MTLFSKEQIKALIPYDDPFLFVDEVEKIRENRISGFYQTSKDDWYFRGHFVDFPIMPGVLTVEALAQLSTILLRQKIGKNHKEYHFLAYDVKRAQFYKPIFPEDKIALQAEVLEVRDNKMAHVEARALVEDELKCETVFSVAIVRKEEFGARYLGQS